MTKNQETQEGVFRRIDALPRGVISPMTWLEEKLDAWPACASEPRNFGNTPIVVSDLGTKFLCQYDLVWEHPSSHHPTGQGVTYEFCVEQLSPTVTSPVCSMLPEGTFRRSQSVVGNSITERYTLTAITGGDTRGGSASKKVFCNDGIIL